MKKLCLSLWTSASSTFIAIDIWMGDLRTFYWSNLELEVLDYLQFRQHPSPTVLKWNLSLYLLMESASYEMNEAYKVRYHLQGSNPNLSYPSETSLPMYLPSPSNNTVEWGLMYDISSEGEWPHVEDRGTHKKMVLAHKRQTWVTLKSYQPHQTKTFLKYELHHLP